jgi:hypothetical protein
LQLKYLLERIYAELHHILTLFFQMQVDEVEVVIDPKDIELSIARSGSAGGGLGLMLTNSQHQILTMYRLLMSLVVATTLTSLMNVCAG